MRDITELDKQAAEIALRGLIAVGDLLKEQGELSRGVRLGWNRDNLELLVDINGQEHRVQLRKISEIDPDSA